MAIPDAHLIMQFSLDVLADIEDEAPLPGEHEDLYTQLYQRMQIHNLGKLYDRPVIFPARKRHTSPLILGLSHHHSLYDRSIYIARNRIQIVNAVPLELLLIGMHRRGDYIPYNRARLVNTDEFMELYLKPFSLMRDKVHPYIHKGWRRKFGICYDRIFREEEIPEMWELYFTDVATAIRRLAGINARITPDTVPCLVLRGHPAEKKLFAADTGIEGVQRAEQLSMTGHYCMDELTAWLDSRLQFSTGLPVINDSGYKGLIKLPHKINITDDLAHLRRQLSAAGLCLEQERMKITMLEVCWPHQDSKSSTSLRVAGLRKHT